MIPLPQNLAAIVFDFDGVILESAGIKVNAFRDIFSRYRAEVDAIVAYHKEPTKGLASGPRDRVATPLPCSPLPNALRRWLHWFRG